MTQTIKAPAWLPDVTLKDVMDPRATLDTWLAVLRHTDDRDLADLAAWLLQPYVVDHVDDLATVGDRAAYAFLQRALPPSLVVSYATQDRPWYVRMAALEHPSCPRDLLATVLAGDPDPTARAIAASALVGPHPAFATAARDVSHIVRLAVANNWTVQRDVVELLLEKDDTRVAALGNPHCPPERLLQECREGLWRHAVANPACPDEAVVEVLLALAPVRRADPIEERQAQPAPRRGWVSRDDVRDEELTDLADELCHRLGPGAWAWLREQRLGRLHERDYRTLVRLNRREAVEDPDPRHRLTVASLPETEPDLLARLITDPDPRVRERVNERILGAASAPAGQH